MESSTTHTSLATPDLLESWPALSKQEKHERFIELPRHEAEDLFLSLSATDQVDLYLEFQPFERRSWVRLLAPDDAADFIQSLSEELKPETLLLLDTQTRSEVIALLAYEEDAAGGLMNSRYARLRPLMTVEEAIRYLRAQTRTQVETIYYAYVLDAEQKLKGVVSLRQLFMASPEKRVEEMMTQGEDLVTVPEDMDQEEIARLFSAHENIALPVIDKEGRMKGIVTVDDIVSAVQEEATEDIHKLGGTEALDAPYFQIGFFAMLKKRAIWLMALFLGETLTATAMGYYEHEIAKAVVLALFIPLIISSGGNSGSQASTLVIRAMALGEVRLRDWWRVFFREVMSGLCLGGILGVVGLFRILLWPTREALYGEHYVRVAVAVSLSVLGTVLWGTLVGAMLPFFFRRFKIDPATASAPFVATLVDVTGLMIYFSVASLIFSGFIL